MDHITERLLVVVADEALRGLIVSVLRDAGYDVSAGFPAGMKAVLSFSPDAAILGANLLHLECCDLLSEIKSSEHTHSIRVLILSPGGPAERTRALDLGADDALSLPIDPHELLARLRLQLRSKHLADESRERLHNAEENQSATNQVVTAVQEERKALRIGGLVIVAVLILVGLVLLYFNHRAQEQNTRVYAAITRLQTGVLTQQKLMERSRAREEEERDPSGSSDTQKQLQKKREDLRSQLASATTEDAAALKDQLTAVESRLGKLESEQQIAQTIIQSYEPSVCLIHVVLAFRDHASGAILRYANVDTNGGPATDEHNNPLVSPTGDGPEIHVDVFGTGFLAAGSGQILTNHHVVEPWWQNDDLKEMLDQGIDPVIAEMTAYFPGASHGISVTTERISSAADVAVVKGTFSGLGIKQIALADGRGSAVSGRPVVLLGYPTALDAILARAGTETVESVVTASNGDPKQMLEELARRHLIRPIATQGHIGDVLRDKIVYDAQTTSGGSGGPLFNNEGKVIGINFAVVREFGGSNFAIPVGFGKPLLKP
jgi:DNA-binding response OmpR family regulator/S1-C subfamily serine protease